MIVGIFRGSRAAPDKVGIFRTCFQFGQNSNIAGNTITKLENRMDRLEHLLRDHLINKISIPQQVTIRPIQKDSPPPFKVEVTVLIDQILTTVSNYFGIKIKDIKSVSRAKEFAIPRQIAMYLIRQNMNLGYKQIGQHLGGKDHTTILHGCHKIKKSIDSDTALSQAVQIIQTNLAKVA